VQAEFQAPAVTSPTYVVVTAMVSSPDYLESASATYIVSVYPRGIQFLSLDLDFPAGDIVTSGGQLPMTIAVRDQDGALAWDSEVSVESLNPQVVSAVPSQGGARDMMRVNIIAAETDASRVGLRVKAEQSGFETAEVAVPVFVVAAIRDVFCPDGSAPDANGNCRHTDELATNLPLVLGGGLAMAAVSSLLFVRHLRNARPRNR